MSRSSPTMQHAYTFSNLQNSKKQRAYRPRYKESSSSQRRLPATPNAPQLTPVRLHCTLTSPQQQPYPPPAQPHRRHPNLLSSFAGATQTLSVSLPSSPVGHDDDEDDEDTYLDDPASPVSLSIQRTNSLNFAVDRNEQKLAKKAAPISLTPTASADRVRVKHKVQSARPRLQQTVSNDSICRLGRSTNGKPRTLCNTNGGGGKSGSGAAGTCSQNISVMVRFRPRNATELKYSQRYLTAAANDDGSAVTKSAGLHSFSHAIEYVRGRRKIKLNYFCGAKKSKQLNGSKFRSYAFQFDRVFPEESTQSDIFESVAKPICDDILSLKSNFGTIFCYGQSGAGKTFTMFGNQKSSKNGANSHHFGARKGRNTSHHRSTSARIVRSGGGGGEHAFDDSGLHSMGIIGNSCVYIFDQLRDLSLNVFSDFSYNIYLECIEIYNEKLRDLLDCKQTPILREIENRSSNRNTSGGSSRLKQTFRTEIQNVTRKQVKSIQEILNILQIASLNRNFAKTSLNENSSRSHMIIRLVVQTVHCGAGSGSGGGGGGGKRTESVLNFVDLAGSESAKKSGITTTTATASAKNQNNLTPKTRKKQITEAGNILKSLTVLSQVIDALIRGKKHIPYKDSKLTRLLQNALGGNCKTALLICASPHIYNRYETIRSLKFGLRCQKIQNVVAVQQHDITPKLTSLSPQQLPTSPSVVVEDVDVFAERSENMSDAESQPSFAPEFDDRKILLQQIKHLKTENAVLRSRNTVSADISELNKMMSKIVLQELTKPPSVSGQKKIESELTIFDNNLVRLSMSINHKLGTLQELMQEACSMHYPYTAPRDDDDGSDDVVDSLSMAHRIEHSSIVTQLRQQNQRLVTQINQLKKSSNATDSASGFTAMKIPSEKTDDCVSGMLLETPRDDDEDDDDEEDDTYYICDDYQNEIAVNSTKKESISHSQSRLQNVKKTANGNVPEHEESFGNTAGGNTTLCEQLNIMDKMRQMDRENLNLLQSPIQRQLSTVKCSLSPRDSITLLNQSKTPQNNTESARSSASSNSSAVSNVSSSSSSSCLSAASSSMLSAQTMICHKNANAQSPSSASCRLLATNQNLGPRDPLVSLGSNTSYYTTPTPSSCGSSMLSNSIQSVPSTASSHSLASSASVNSRSRSQSTEERTCSRNIPGTGTLVPKKHTFLTQSSTTETVHHLEDAEDEEKDGQHFASCAIADLEQQKQEIHKCMDDAVLQEENETDIDDDDNDENIDETDDEIGSENESTDDETYYFNNFSLNDPGNMHAANPMFRQRTDSQIFRESGLELSRKLKAQSVESPCHNNQRLSSTFALHWINLKK